MSQVTVPDLVNRILDEFGHGTLSRFIRFKVMDKDGVVGLAAGMDDSRCIIRDGWICQRALWDGESGPPRRRVGGSGFNEANEVVCASRLVVVGDVQQKGV